MFDQQVGWTGIRFGVIGGLVSFAFILLIYFFGLNPYGNYRLYSLIFIPIFVFFGIGYFKKFTDIELGFVKAFRVGLSVAFFAALSSAMLLYLFTFLAGPELFQEFIKEGLAIMEASKVEMIKIIGAEKYQEGYDLVRNTTNFELAEDEFMKKLFVGIIASVIGAIFFRK